MKKEKGDFKIHIAGLIKIELTNLGWKQALVFTACVFFLMFCLCACLKSIVPAGLKAVFHFFD